MFRACASVQGAQGPLSCSPSHAAPLMQPTSTSSAGGSSDIRLAGTSLVLSLSAFSVGCASSHSATSSSRRRLRLGDSPWCPAPWLLASRLSCAPAPPATPAPPMPPVPPAPPTTPGPPKPPAPHVSPVPAAFESSQQNLTWEALPAPSRDQMLKPRSHCTTSTSAKKPMKRPYHSTEGLPGA